MRLSHLISRVAVAALMASACHEPTVTERGPIVGSWLRASEALSPTGSYQYRFTFTPTGEFTSEVRMYGAYAGQSPGDLSSYGRTEGTYRTDGDRLIVKPLKLTTWDRFYGASSPVRVDVPYPYTGFFDDTRYDVLDRKLTLRYTTYPADAPVPTTMVLDRTD